MKTQATVNTTTARNSILWGVNALSLAPNEQVATLRSLQLIFPNREKKIGPVYVIKRADLDFSQDMYSLRAYELCPRAESNVREMLAGDRSARVLEPRFLIQMGNSKREAAQELIKYALTHQFSVIAVTATPGLPLLRYFRNSFIESLLRLSPIPVLVANPGGPRGVVGNLVYATNAFSESRRVFAGIVAQWGRQAEGITVFVGNGRKWSEQALWTQIAEDHGVTVDFRFTPSARMSVDDLFVETGKLKNPFLVFDYKHGFGLRAVGNGFSPRFENSRFPILLVKPGDTFDLGGRPRLKLISNG